MADILTRERFEAALCQASDYGPVEAILRRPESQAQFEEARAAATLPPDLTDQKGRQWSRWATTIPGHYRLCKKCGCKIREGYILEPHVTTAICEKHVKQRWL